MASYAVDENAYLVALLHAAKFPSSTVNGLLLGPPTSGNSRNFRITAAIPLFHTSTALAPCTDTALTQVDAWASQQGLRIQGYYHAEAQYGPATELPALGRRVADRIADRQPATFALVLDAPRLQAFCAPPAADAAADAVAVPPRGPFELFLRESTGGPKGSQWKRVADSSSGSYTLACGGVGGWDALRARFLNVHAKGLHRQLADFDEHLDDLRCDYTNAGLLGADTALISK